MKNSILPIGFNCYGEPMKSNGEPLKIEMALSKEIFSTNNSALLEYVIDQGLNSNGRRFLKFRIPVSVIHPRDLNIDSVAQQFHKYNVTAVYDEELDYGNQTAPGWIATIVYIEEN